jgi:hypothetical protein
MVFALHYNRIVGDKLCITTLGREIVRIILVYLLTRGAQVISRFRGQGASERSKHVGTIIVLLAQPLPSCVTACYGIRLLQLAFNSKAYLNSFLLLL